MNLLNDAIDFLTDPAGLGLPILIAAGLGIILYLMKYTSKTWVEVDKEIKGSKKDKNSRKIPYKPF